MDKEKQVKKFLKIAEEIKNDENFNFEDSKEIWKKVLFTGFPEFKKTYELSTKFKKELGDKTPFKKRTIKKVENADLALNVLLKYLGLRFQDKIEIDSYPVIKLFSILFENFDKTTTGNEILARWLKEYNDKRI